MSDFAQSRALAAWFNHTEAIDSTNADLLSQAANLPSWSVSVTDLQTAGRGRSGRNWDAPAQTSLLASVLIRPAVVPATDFGWLPLIAGLSMADAITRFSGRVVAGVKWPNDLLIGENKVCGILSELLPDATGVVIGSGVNVFQSAAEIALDTATSLAVEEIAVPSIDDLLATYLNELKHNVVEFEAHHSQFENSELYSRIRNACISLDRNVRVILPSGEEYLGVAVDIDTLGRLVVQRGVETLAVSAGDVMHLRHN